MAIRSGETLKLFVPPPGLSALCVTLPIFKSRRRDNLLFMRFLLLPVPVSESQACIVLVVT